jgi:hypothetical protein
MFIAQRGSKYVRELLGARVFRPGGLAQQTADRGMAATIVKASHDAASSTAR